MLQSDGECEFKNTFLSAHFLQHGIYFRKSFPDTQEQNGLSIISINFLIRSLMLFSFVEAHVPATFWVYTIQTAYVFIRWLSTNICQCQSPFKRCFLNILITIFSKLLVELSNFFCTKIFSVFFLGYALHYKGYICFNLLMGHVYISRHVIEREKKRQKLEQKYPPSFFLV